MSGSRLNRAADDSNVKQAFDPLGDVHLPRQSDDNYKWSNSGPTASKPTDDNITLRTPQSAFRPPEIVHKKRPPASMTPIVSSFTMKRVKTASAKLSSAASKARMDQSSDDRDVFKKMQAHLSTFRASRTTSSNRISQLGDNGLKMNYSNWKQGAFDPYNDPQQTEGRHSYGNQSQSYDRPQSYGPTHSTYNPMQSSSYSSQMQQREHPQQLHSQHASRFPSHGMMSPSESPHERHNEAEMIMSQQTPTRLERPYSAQRHGHGMMPASQASQFDHSQFNNHVANTGHPLQMQPASMPLPMPEMASQRPVETVSTDIIIPEPEDMPEIIDDGMKPTYSYAMLIGMAILRAPGRKLTLAQIYAWIMETFKHYKETKPAWHNSIRHNLSLNKAFEKQVRPKDEPGKGNYWRIAEGHEHQFVRPRPPKRSVEMLLSADNRSDTSTPSSSVGNDTARQPDHRFSHISLEMAPQQGQQHQQYTQHQPRSAAASPRLTVAMPLGNATSTSTRSKQPARRMSGISVIRQMPIHSSMSSTRSSSVCSGAAAASVGSHEDTTTPQSNLVSHVSHSHDPIPSDNTEPDESIYHENAARRSSARDSTVQHPSSAPSTFENSRPALSTSKAPKSANSSTITQPANRQPISLLHPSASLAKSEVDSSNSSAYINWREHSHVGFRCSTPSLVQQSNNTTLMIPGQNLGDGMTRPLKYGQSLPPHLLHAVGNIVDNAPVLLPDTSNTLTDGLKRNYDEYKLRHNPHASVSSNSEGKESSPKTPEKDLKQGTPVTMRSSFADTFALLPPPKSFESPYAGALDLSPGVYLSNRSLEFGGSYSVGNHMDNAISPLHTASAVSDTLVANPTIVTTNTENSSCAEKDRSANADLIEMDFNKAGYPMSGHTRKHERVSSDSSNDSVSDSIFPSNLHAMRASVVHQQNGVAHTASFTLALDCDLTYHDVRTPVRRPFDTPIRDQSHVYSPYCRGTSSYGSPMRRR